MDGTLRNMTSIYISKGNKMLLLYRQGSKVVNDVWVGSAGGHFEEFELNDARACVLRELQEELGIAENEIKNLCLRYVTLRRNKGCKTDMIYGGIADGEKVVFIEMTEF